MSAFKLTLELGSSEPNTLQLVFSGLNTSNNSGLSLNSLSVAGVGSNNSLSIIDEIAENPDVPIAQIVGRFRPDTTIVNYTSRISENRVYNVPKRTISQPIDSSSSLGKRLRDLNSNSNPSDKGISKKQDPGYTKRKSMIVTGVTSRFETYTEDRSLSQSYIAPDGRVYILMVVADGHSGSYQCAKHVTAFMSIHFEEIANEQFVVGQELNVEQVLLRLFDRTQRYIDTNRDQIDNSGSTCCACIISESTKRLTIANLGDSVCMVVRDGIVLDRTRDQDAKCSIEQVRILQIDPTATFKSRRGDPAIRLNGGLMPVGGFGDYRHESVPGVIRRVPVISTVQLEAGDHVILATDGLYETFLPEGMLGGGRPDVNIATHIHAHTQNEEFHDIHIADFLFEKHIEEIVQIMKESGRFHPDTPDKTFDEMARNGKDNTAILVYKA